MKDGNIPPLSVKRLFVPKIRIYTGWMQIVMPDYTGPGIKKCIEKKVTNGLFYHERVLKKEIKDIKDLHYHLEEMDLREIATDVGMLNGFNTELIKRVYICERLLNEISGDIEDILNVTKAQKETINSYKKLSDAYKDSLQMSILEELLKEKSKNEKTSLEKENYENKGLVRKFFETIKKFKR